MTKYSIELTNKFKKQVKNCIKRGYKMQRLWDVMLQLEASGSLPSSYRPHKLKGNRDGQWECHIEPDWLMIWEQNDDIFTLLFIETGTHSDLF